MLANLETMILPRFYKPKVKQLKIAGQTRAQRTDVAEKTSY